MIEIKIDIVNLETVQNRLSETGDGLTPILEEWFAQDAVVLQYAAQVYPDPIPTSDYVRTYDYQRSIQPPEVTVEGTEVTYAEKSTSPYDEYLRGDPETGYPGAWMHIGRWRTWVDIMATFLPVLFFKANERVSEIINRMWVE